MTEPLFWLGLSVCLVSVSLTAVLVVALPTFIELRRAAQSADKLFTTLERDFPPALEAIRLTGVEISELSEDLDEGVKSAGNVVKQVDQSLNTVKQQAGNVQVGTRSLWAGVKVAWRTWRQPATPSNPNLPSSSRPSLESPLKPPLQSEKESIKAERRGKKYS